MGQARQRGTFEERKEKAMRESKVITWPRHGGKVWFRKLLATLAGHRARRLRPNDNPWLIHQAQQKILGKMNNVKVILDDEIKQA